MTNPKSRRRGFTLVELLVVVMIITILATIVLFAMSAATEAARIARTRSMVARINDLITPMWESYRTRRVPITTANDPYTAAGQRLNALRELMRMELPERRTDVEDAPTGFARPSLNIAYQRYVAARTADWTEPNQGSECLYMILSRIQDGDTNGLEFVRETEIGDTDGDGMPEILDGWGKPIAFLRWAPGFIPANGGLSAIQDELKADPFDPLQVKSGTYYLFPLVFSAGPDRDYAIHANPNVPGFRYSLNGNDPFAVSPKFGTPDAAANTYHDNIHNHLISTGID